MSLIPFAAVTELDTPDLDTNFNALGALSSIPCTATGTNTIALAPLAGPRLPDVASYTSTRLFTFFAAASTSTSPVTLNFNGLGAKKLYKNNGQTLAGTNDLISGALYLVMFNQALDTGNGGFIICNQVNTGTSMGSVPGKSVKVLGVTASDTTYTITADAVALWDGSTSFQLVTSVNVTINAAVTGANGLDTGSLANNTWYYAYVIYNPGTTTTAGLLSTSATSPSLPSGYTMYARTGALPTDGTAKLHRIRQAGNNAQYVVGAGATLVLRQIATGIAGTWSATAPVWVSASVANLVPPMAATIRIVIDRNFNNASAADVIVAPSNSYSGANTTNPPWFSSTTGTAFPTLTIEMGLESTSVFWASTATGGGIFCAGWTDNL